MRSTTVPDRTRKSRAPLWLAGVFLFCFTYFLPKPGDWNQNARLDLALAIVNHGTVQTDPYHWQAGDDIFYRGHYYSNKAPGQTLVGVPVLLAYKGMLTVAGNGAMAQKMGTRRAGLMANYNFYLWQCLESWYTVAVPSTIFLLLFYWFLGYFSRSRRNRILLTLGLGLATDWFSYSGLFYPHTTTGGLLFAAFAILYIAGRLDRARGRASSWLARHEAPAVLLAGGTLGFAFLFDHTSALPGLLIGAYALTRVPVRRIPLLALGALPFLLITLGYDYVTFHNIGVTGYNTSGPGLGGSDAGGPPRAYALFGMSISPYRGLFFLSPFLLLAIPGYRLWGRRKGAEWMLFLAIPVVFYVFVCIIPYWYGGWAVGPRYLIPTLPFLALPIIFVLDAIPAGVMRVGTIALFVVSALAIWVETLTPSGPGYPPTKISDPLFTYNLTALLRGDIRLNMGSFIVGPAAGAHSILTLVPLAVLIGAWTAYCTRRRRASLTEVAVSPAA